MSDIKNYVFAKLYHYQVKTSEDEKWSHSSIAKNDCFQAGSEAMGPDTLPY